MVAHGASGGEAPVAGAPAVQGGVLACRSHDPPTRGVPPYAKMNRDGDRSTRIHRSALVPFSAAMMFDLVADVAAYPAFLPWCRGAWVHSADARSMEATLEIAKGPLRKRFRTRNELHPSHCIEIRLVEGPFRRLEGRWQFDDLGEEGARVSLDMRFEVAGGLLARPLGPVFGEIANTLVDAFCRRARTVYAR
jgi:ribosome-associated toxin RatA of RatAB toxin-antitoxin module